MVVVAGEQVAKRIQEYIEELAFTYLKLHLNESALTNNLITKGMYTFAKDELQKSIDLLSNLCYYNGKGGISDGFIEDKETT